MLKNIYKMTDSEFSFWLENFQTEMEANKAALGITDEVIAEVLGLKTGFNTALTEKQATDELKQSKTAVLRDKRKITNKKVASLSKIFKANEDVPASLIELLGLDANDGNLTLSTPQQPTELTVEGFSNGINQLKWNRNGNKPNTVYIIEGRIESEPNFSFAGTTTKRKFADKNQTPGIRKFYRVRAMRHDQESTNSNEAVVY